MALLPIGLLAAGGALQAYGQYSQGQAQGKAEDQNAATQREAARLSLEKGAFDAEQTRKAGLKLTSSQEAQYSANGVALSGSPLLVIEESQANNETDALLQQYNAKIEAKRYASDASYRSQLAYNYRMNGIVSAGSTLLTTAANIGLNYGTAPKTVADTRLAPQVNTTYRNPTSNNLTFKIKN